MSEIQKPKEKNRMCRACGYLLTNTFINLGAMPLANSLLEEEQLYLPEVTYPLHAFICDNCFLAQVEQFNPPADIFSDYVYFSSFSDTCLNHASRYVEDIVQQIGLDEKSFVVELASNDGYLLQHFLRKRIPVLGIEPATNVAKTALERGVPTWNDFFCRTLAAKVSKQYGHADLIVANNVLAHVPELNDFISGLKALMKPDGIATIEFPHLLYLLQNTQFDTIYHEHFSYFSFAAAERVFSRHGLVIFDVEELPTHGGSLRIYVCHENDNTRHEEERVLRMREKEREAELECIKTYTGFAKKSECVKRDLLAFLVKAKTEGKRVACYGAAAKGSTLLNYCGIGRDLIEFVVDRSPHKQGKFMAGSHIPIRHPDVVAEFKPDYLLILAWNLREEIAEQMDYIRKWGGEFVLPIPNVEVTA